MKTIEFSLSPESIAKACNKLDWYKKTIEHRTERLRKLIASRILWSAQSGFNTATRDGILGGDPLQGNVLVEMQEEGQNVTVVFTNSEDAVFIEFGTGVYFNGSAGSSPHPQGAEFGYLIGTYGLGNGAKNVWGFTDESGQFHLTHGAPAAMPMYNGMKDAIDALADLANEVFGND